MKLNDRGLLIVISGPSGVGKGTVRKALFDMKGHNLTYSVSMTTRKMRPGEVNGREYYFVTKEEFMENVARDNLLEWAEYVGNCYGTPRDKVEAMRNEGKNVLLEIDVKGAANVFNKVQDVISIFIAPPSVEELGNRLRGRGTESEEVITNRVSQAMRELEYKDLYKYVVINDKLEDCVNEIRQIIKSKM
jgi:guanylate kinase